MSRQEIMKRIEELERHNFMLNMGHWDLFTRDIIMRNDNEIKELKGKLQDV